MSRNAHCRTKGREHLAWSTPINGCEEEYIFHPYFFVCVFFQELLESAYTLYNEMVFVTLDIDEFAHWASRFVPRDYLFPSLSLSLCGLTWLSSAQYLFRRSLKMNGRNKTKLSLRRVLTFTHRLFSFKWHSFEMHSTAIFHSLWTCGQDLVSLWAGSSWKGREGTVLYPLTK